MKTEYSKNWKLGSIFKGAVKPENDTAYNTGWDHQTAYIESDSGIIGEVKAMNIVNFASIETFEANAALMVAAPELLEALKDLWVRSTNLFGELTVKEIEDNEQLRMLSESIDNAKRVIAKATTFDESAHRVLNC